MTYTTALLIADDDYAVSIQPSGNIVPPNTIWMSRRTSLQRRC
ncbi:MAG TPA: hypothetical protein VJS13_15795 [Pyrinomonadaceae bacterium]|nr:hypothetical protein [Pyrinomonadaceae bacterium]